MSDKKAIRPRDRDTILQALSAGVVPRVGLQHIQVGRVDEIKAITRDIERMADGGSAFRLLIGEYGAGKTFLLHLIRMIALEKRMVTIHADLAPDRRIYAGGGEARNLYQEAVRNLSTRNKPEGGALQSVVERFVGDSIQAGTAQNKSADEIIRERLAPLQDLVGGYDYVTVLFAYARGHITGHATLCTDALRWLRGEFTTKTDARKSLDVRTLIDDANVYDSLKLLGSFVRIAGYAGLLVVFDEMVNLYKLQHAQSRNQNYEQILRIINDVFQGNVTGFGVILGGTPEFLMDTRRGLYSYEALRSRLAENPYARGGLIDLAGPVVRLPNLTPEDLLVLLENIRSVVDANSARAIVPDDALTAFMEHCKKQIGDEYFRTPRNSVKAFVQLLSVVEQNPTADWRQLLGQVRIEQDNGAILTATDSATDDDLSTFQL
jgi:hypothetical protein